MKKLLRFSCFFGLALLFAHLVGSRLIPALMNYPSDVTFIVGLALIPLSLYVALRLLFYSVKGL